MVYDFVKQDVAITAGAYINRANGSIVANSAFDCAVFSYTTGDRWKVTARVNGSGVSLAVYTNNAGTVIGTEVAGTTESVDFIDYELSPPAGTAKSALQHESPSPLLPKICCRSRWWWICQPLVRKKNRCYGRQQRRIQQVATTCRGRAGMFIPEPRRWRFENCQA